MTGLVLHASAALKLLNEEPGQTDVRVVLRSRIEGGRAILVPGLFWLQVINVLAVRLRWAPAAIVEAVYELEQLGIETAGVDRPTALAVVDAVGRFGLTAYDAAYLVLAEAADAQLLTADADLAAAAGTRAIFVGERRIGEVAAPHAPADAWPTWRGATAYLAELRSSI